jgi:hypothetical protein
VATTFNPGPDPYDGLAMCPSLTTALAARAGKDVVTYQPADSGAGGMELRINGTQTALATGGVNLPAGGRVVKSPADDGIEILFPDGTVLIANPGWWASAGKWYLNVQTGRTRAEEGIMGAIADGSWLPALPSGESLGAMPASLHQRFVVLNQFADAWRVTPDTSLFDYAPGTSTATFTLAGWPSENSPCAPPGGGPSAQIGPALAQAACKGLVEANARDDCVFDVLVTGDTGFAKTHLDSQRIRAGATITMLAGDSSTSMIGAPVTFTAMVALLASEAKGAPAGAVQFSVDGTPAGDPVRLDANGRATWTTPALTLGARQIAATYLVPANVAGSLPSDSATEIHTVTPWWSGPPK